MVRDRVRVNVRISLVLKVSSCLWWPLGIVALWNSAAMLNYACEAGEASKGQRRLYSCYGGCSGMAKTTRAIK